MNEWLASLTGAQVFALAMAGALIGYLLVWLIGIIILLLRGDI